MNPQRLVAAVAALAIGFGVTLAGVGLADDEVASDSSAQDEDVGDFEAEGEEVEEGEPAEQQAEVAEEADPAEVEPATSAPVNQVETEQAPTSSTCDDLVEAGASDEKLNDAGCVPAGPRVGQEIPPSECFEVYEIEAQDGRVLIARSGFFPDASGEIILPSGSTPVRVFPIVADVSVRDAVQVDDDLFVDCATNETFEDIDGASLLAELQEFDDGFGGDADGFEDSSGGSSPDGDEAPCRADFNEFASLVTDGFEEFQEGEGIDVKVGSDSASQSDFFLYLQLMAALLDEQTSSPPDPGWLPNLQLVTAEDRFADVDCDEFDQQINELENRFLEVQTGGQYRQALGLAVCLLGELSTLNEQGRPLTNSIFGYLAANGSVGGCQPDPALTNTEN